MKKKSEEVEVENKKTEKDENKNENENKNKKEENEWNEIRNSFKFQIGKEFKFLYQVPQGLFHRFMVKLLESFPSQFLPSKFYFISSQHE